VAVELLHAQDLDGRAAGDDQAGPLLHVEALVIDQAGRGRNARAGAPIDQAGRGAASRAGPRRPGDDQPGRLLHVEAPELSIHVQTPGPATIDQAGRGGGATSRICPPAHRLTRAAVELLHVQDLDGDDRTGCRHTDRRGQFIAW
jgi:hypothetical protein